MTSTKMKNDSISATDQSDHPPAGPIVHQIDQTAHQVQTGQQRQTAGRGG